MVILGSRAYELGSRSHHSDGIECIIERLDPDSDLAWSLTADDHHLPRLLGLLIIIILCFNSKFDIALITLTLHIDAPFGGMRSSCRPTTLREWPV
jgi:hypothetical protein